jgi:hypothetical protein
MTTFGRLEPHLERNDQGRGGWCHRSSWGLGFALYEARKPHSHRGLPSNLDEVPRTPEFERGLEWLRRSGGYAPEEAENFLDYRLRFLNQLETCYGPLPNSESIQYEPKVDGDGRITQIGSASRVDVVKATGLGDREDARLEDCGKVAYNLPLHLRNLPT